MQPFDLIGCSNIEFVIKSYDKIVVYIVEFELGDEWKLYYSEKDKVKFLRMDTKCTKST